jgi:DNA polymerase-3 subunit epsilon
MSGLVRASATGGRLSWREAAFCVVDLELTGLDPRSDEIVSFGAVPVDDARVAVGRAVYGLVRPVRPLPEASVLIHGIRPVDLDGAPRLAEAIRPLVDAMTGRVLVAHSASIERAFLGAALRRWRGRLRGPFVDTEILGRLLMAERGASVPPFLSLGELAAYLRLPEHRPHHALGDALTTAQAFIALASHLEATGIATVKSLTQAVDRLSWLKR